MLLPAALCLLRGGADLAVLGRGMAASASLLLLVWRPPAGASMGMLRGLRPACLLLLAGLACPIAYGPLLGLDGVNQQLTSCLAAGFLGLVGVPVEQRWMPEPELWMSPSLSVHITSLCAGAEPTLALLVLGILLAMQLGKASLLVTPALIGWLSNVGRVALSAWVAQVVFEEQVASQERWLLLHDGVAYGVAAVGYGMMAVHVGWCSGRIGLRGASANRRAS